MDFLEKTPVITRINLAIRVPAGCGEPLHRNRPTYGIALHLEGEKLYRFEGGRELVVCKNDLIFLPRQSNYYVDSRVEGECYAINFSLAEDLTFEPFVLHMKNAFRVLEHFKSAEKAFRAKKSGYEYRCFADTYAVLQEMSRVRYMAYPFFKSDKRLIPAIDYIHEHFHEGKIELETLAALCDLSVVYFRRLFEGVFGLSPIKYINGLKLERAKELLSSGLYSVEAVCRLSGFENMSYFCRFFKSSSGEAPGQYARSSIQKKE